MQASKRSHCMFGIIIIPRYIVIIKKCEESILIFVDSLFQRGANLSGALERRHVV